jgi:hypothetical protein
MQERLRRSPGAGRCDDPSRCRDNTGGSTPSVPVDVDAKATENTPFLRRVRPIRQGHPRMRRDRNIRVYPHSQRQAAFVRPARTPFSTGLAA